MHVLPRPPEGWIWRGFAAAGDPPTEPSAGELASHDQIVDELVRRLEKDVRTHVGTRGAKSLDVRRSGKYALVVRAPQRVQRDIEAFLGSLTWTPYWPGFRLAGEELADMSLHGTSTERGWAASALRDAPAALQCATQAALARQERQAESPRLAAYMTGESVARIRVELRLLRTSRDLIRDLGCPVIYNDGLPPPEVAEHAQSMRFLLDDVELAIIERVVERGELVQSIESGTVWFLCGETRSVSLSGDDVLTMRADVSKDKWYVSLHVRLRLMVEGALLFSPSREWRMPDGCTVLMYPADTLVPSAPASESLLFMLTASVVPSPADNLEPEYEPPVHRWSPFDD